MDCRYINLDAAAERRAALEGNFQAHKAEGWTLNRFAAIDVAYVQAHDVAGSITPAEKACFLSHREVLRASLDREGPLCVLEDDAAFGAKTCGVIDQFLQGGNAGLEWDILFTDVCVTQLSAMLDLVKMRRRLAAKNKVSLLDLAKIPFAGAAAYIVNPQSKRRVCELLDAGDCLDLQYDLYLRQLIYASKLKAYVFFPFITTLSALADASQIQNDDGKMTDRVWILFRQMVWNERALEQHEIELDEIHEQFCDDESRAFGKLWGALADARFKDK